MAEIPEWSRSEQVTHGGALLLLGGVSGRVMLYAVNLLLARSLSVAELGRYFLAVTLLQALTLLGTLGIDLGLLRFAPQWEAEGRNRLGPALQGLLIACLLACLVCAGGLASSVSWLVDAMQQPGLVLAFWWVAWILPAVTLHRVVSNLFQALFRVPSAVLLRNLLYPILFLTLLVPALLIDATAGTVLLVQGLAAALPASLGLWWLSRRYASQGSSPSSRWPATLEVLRFSVPLMLAGAIGYGALWLDSFLVGWFLKAEALGRYGIAFRISLVGTVLLESFNGALGPAASRLIHQGGEGLEAVYQDTTRLVLILFLPLLGAMWLFPETLLGLFGPAFRNPESILALRILALGQLINVGVGGAGMLLVMAGRPWLNLMNGVGMILLNLGLSLLLIPRWGLAGAALASAGGVVAINLARLLEVRWLLNVRPMDRRWGKPVLAWTVASVLALAIRLAWSAPGGEWAGLGVLGLAYAGGLVLFGLEPGERQLLRRIRSRGQGM